MGPDDRVTEFPGNGPSFIYSTILGFTKDNDSVTHIGVKFNC